MDPDIELTDLSFQDRRTSGITAVSADPPARRRSPPALRIDTTRNVDINDDDPNGDGIQQPQSAILDMAMQDRNGLDMWLKKDKGDANSLSPCSRNRSRDYASSEQSGGRSPRSVHSRSTGNELLVPSSTAYRSKSYVLDSGSHSHSSSLSIPNERPASTHSDPTDGIVSFASDSNEHSTDSKQHFNGAFSPNELLTPSRQTPPNQSNDYFGNYPVRSRSKGSISLKVEKTFSRESIDEGDGSRVPSTSCDIERRNSVPPQSPLEHLANVSTYQESDFDTFSRTNFKQPFSTHTSVDQELPSNSHPVGRTLFVFTEESEFRKRVFEMVSSKQMLTTEIILTILEMAVLSIEVADPFDVNNDGLPLVAPRKTLYPMIAFFSVFTFIAVLKSIAYGVFTNRALSSKDLGKVKRFFVKAARSIVFARYKKDAKDEYAEEQKEHHNSPGFDRIFLRTSWGRVEFLSLVFFWSATISTLVSTPNSLTLIVSGLGHLRLLKVLDYIPFTRVVLTAFKLAMPLLANVLFYIGFFVLLLGTVGLQAFNGSLRRVCVYDAIVTQQQCGSYLEKGTLRALPYLYLDDVTGSLMLQTVVKGFQCPVGSTCVEFRTHPSIASYQSFSARSFDNIFNALEIVFIIMSNNSFTEIMYQIIDAEYLVSCIFFVVGVLILAIWLMNLLVAVMVSCYSRVSDVLQSSGTFKFSIFSRLYTRLKSIRKKWDLEEQRAMQEADDGVEYANQRDFVPRKSKWRQMYSYFYPVLAILALVDVIVQACSTAPETNLYNWEVSLASIFLADIVWRFVIYLPYWRSFLLSFMNLFDLFLAIANSIVLVFYGDATLYGWLTIFQLVRVYRIIGSIKFIRDFWMQLYGNFVVLANLTVFFFLTTLLCTLVACKMLRGQTQYLTDGEINIHSFYDLAASYFSMYQISSTENWTDVLFWNLENVIRPGRNVFVLACIGILFCGWLFFANFLIFNLFIGVMSENLFETTIDKKEEQVKGFAHDVLKEGGVHGEVLTDYNGVDNEDDNEDDEGFHLHETIAKFFRKIRNKGEKNTSRISKNLRATIEREFVIEFLEFQELQKKDDEDLEDEEDEDFDDDERDIDTIKTKRDIRHVLNEQQGNSSHQCDSEDNSFDRTDSETAEEAPHRKVHVENAAQIHNAWTVALLDKFRHVFQWGISKFFHYPVNYRNELHNRLEKRRLDAKANSNSAYVNEMFDYNQQMMIVLTEYCESHPYFDRSLFLFSNKNKIRIFFQRLFPSSHGLRVSGVYPKRWVGFYIRTFFLLLSVALIIQTCINTPLYTLEERTRHPGIVWTWLHTIDLIFGILFTIEFLGKVIADGFHYTPNAYTSSFWNLLDFIVLISIWITFFSDVSGSNISRYVRAWMALRALRLISIHRKSERIFNSIFVYGFKDIMAAGVIAMSIVVPYAIWGKNIFHNKLLGCNDSSVESLDDCVGEFVQTVYNNFPILTPRAIEHVEYFNYDTFWSALLIQFGVLSLEGWVDVLSAVTSITGINSQPETYASKANAVYPILYDYIRALLIISMFIAVIIRNYSITMGTAYLTEHQLAWRDLKRTLRLARPSPCPPKYPKDSFRAALLNVVPTWVASIEVWALLVSTATMFAYYYPLSDDASLTYQLILIACTIVLLSTFILRLFILKWRLFMHDWWNPLGLIICVTVLGITISSAVNSQLVAFGFRNASRALYVCVLVLWIPRVKLLNQFYVISTFALTEIFKLLYAWFTLYVAFAIALNQSFGLTKLGVQSTWSRNFRTVPKAMIILFTMSCGEGWNQLLLDYTISYPYCFKSSTESECGIGVFAYILFIAWNIVSMYVFANLFISLICEACWYIYRSAPVNVSDQDIASYKETWQEMDPSATGYIDAEMIYQFLGMSRGYFTMSIFHQDKKYSVRNILKVTQAGELPSDDPYKVNFDRILEYLEDLPVGHYKEKAQVYTYFTTHAQLLAETRSFGNKIEFGKLLRLFPLYKDINPAESLSIKEFIGLNVELHEVKVKLAVDVISVRWLKNRHLFTDWTLNEDAHHLHTQSS